MGYSKTMATPSRKGRQPMGSSKLTNSEAAPPTAFDWQQVLLKFPTASLIGAVAARGDLISFCSSFDRQVLCVVLIADGEKKKWWIRDEYTAAKCFNELRARYVPDKGKEGKIE